MDSKHKAYVIYDTNKKQYISYNEDGMFWYHVPYLATALMFTTEKRAKEEIEQFVDTNICVYDLVIIELKPDIPG